MRNQTLDERQREILSTCMPSCRNIVYPSLGMCEENAEYVQKLLYLINWDDSFPKAEREHLEQLLKGFVHLGLAIGAYAKRFRHENIVPFSLKKDENVEFPHLLHERIEGIRRECGDMNWMINAIDFFIANPDGTDPTNPDTLMTAQLTADQNFQKLAERRAANTIDGKGDTHRSKL